MLARGIELSERVGFSVKLLAMRVRLANVETLRGNVERAEQMHLDLLKEIADEAIPWLRTMSLIGLATIGRRTQRPERASSWIEQAWTISRSRDAPMIQALVLVGRGYTADLLGQYEQAIDHQRQGLAIALAHFTPRGVANSMEGMAGALAIAPNRSLHAAAARLLGAADTLRRRSGGAMPPAERFDVDRAERRGRRSLGGRAFDVAFAEGAGSDVETRARRGLRAALTRRDAQVSAGPAPRSARLRQHGRQHGVRRVSARSRSIVRCAVVPCGADLYSL